MKDEIELFRVEIVRERRTGEERIRVWELERAHANGQTSRIVADAPLLHRKKRKKRSVVA